jgi:hypothetical protein
LARIKLLVDNAYSWALSIIQTRMIIKAVIDEKITKIMKKTTNVVAAVTVAD